MPMVIGSVPNCVWVDCSLAAKMRPLSPRITFVPEPPVIVIVARAADDDRAAVADRDRVVAAVRRSVEPTRSIVLGSSSCDAQVRCSGFASTSAPVQVM